MTDPYPVRPISPAEFDAYALVNQHAFHYGPGTDSDRADTLSRLEWDRTLAAFDPELAAPVGITGIYSFQMTVPGASLPVAGVTWVGVLPSHRRRGILSTLMRRQLSDIAARGESLAALWASEAGIYGRYGYGRASWHLAFDVRRGEGGVLPGAFGSGAFGSGAFGRGGAGAGGLRTRLVATADARPELAKVYDLVLQTRPGFFARNTAWWDRLLYDPESHRNGAGPLRCVLAQDDQGARGYALYSGTQRWEEPTFLPDSTLNVRELVAADAAASATLWNDLLSRDLVTSYHASLRPVDDPLLYQLADPRRVRPTLADGLWVRLVNVPAALTGRRYASPVDVVIEVHDSYLADNVGRWRLRAGPSGGSGGFSGGSGGFAASCERTSDPADLSLDVAELGAAYMGGTRLSAPAGAGLVTEHRPGAVRELSTAMSWDPAPWCPMIF
jgi:predicted acetyltransferase